MIVSLTCDDLLFLCYQEVYRTKEEEMLKTLLCENAKPPLPGSRRSRCCGDASTGAPRRSGERREAIPTHPLFSRSVLKQKTTKSKTKEKSIPLNPRRPH